MKRWRVKFGPETKALLERYRLSENGPRLVMWLVRRAYVRLRSGPRRRWRRRRVPEFDLMLIDIFLAGTLEKFAEQANMEKKCENTSG